ncbi:hypothetical protein [Thermodesulfobacterium sp.]|jgi:hypothetical protein|uniref:hypothetical protein n=1 Tax=Thermodesulfobacterium sp. TaxID=1965289 RepID=UPI002580A930|nr:hypothetical protein [Thermodesulfobacterium sp.]MBZ4682328.1 hypothetical protein [Thermodesulfobacterium sp.]
MNPTPQQLNWNLIYNFSEHIIKKRFWDTRYEVKDIVQEFLLYLLQVIKKNPHPWIGVSKKTSLIYQRISWEFSKFITRYDYTHLQSIITSEWHERNGKNGKNRKNRNNNKGQLRLFDIEEKKEEFCIVSFEDFKKQDRGELW